MKYEKVIIKRPFKGNAQSVVLKGGRVAFSDLTAEEYLIRNPGCELISWEEYDKLVAEMFLSPLQPVTESYYYEKLEELPPLKYRVLGRRFETFFCAEATTGLFHGFNVHDKVTDRYFAGTKSIAMSDDALLAEVEAETAAIYKI